MVMIPRGCFDGVSVSNVCSCHVVNLVPATRVQGQEDTGSGVTAVLMTGLSAGTPQPLLRVNV